MWFAKGKLPFTRPACIMLYLFLHVSRCFTVLPKLAAAGINCEYAFVLQADFSIESQLSAGIDTAIIAGYRTVTNIRLKLVEPNAILKNYEILEWAITGSCMCNGHASRCIPIHGENNTTVVHTGCLCEHNTTGDHCEMCAVGYNSLPWRPGNATAANACASELYLALSVSCLLA